MTTASDRVPLTGLSLADAHKIQDELRSLSLYLRDDVCYFRSQAQEQPAGSSLATLAREFWDSASVERERVLEAREALSRAIAATLNGL